jgi:putative ABC transport system ATP-binding protein
MKKEKPIIEIKEVWKIYEIGKTKVYALRGLNITIDRDDFVAIMGPSGSGKSTAMNMVGALDIPTKGHIFLEGMDIAEMSESELSQIRGKKIGFIFQQFNLINTLNALENVMLPMVFQGVSSEDRLSKATHLLNLVGLGDRMYNKPTELSGGQQQRVAIARALANDPDVILADEPTGNLDSKTGEMIMGILCSFHEKEKKTIIVVTHDEIVARCAHRIIKLKDGKVLGGK